MPSTEKQIFVRDLNDRDVVQSKFLVRSKKLLQDRSGKAFLILQLGDRTGEIEARIWDDAAEVEKTFEEGQVVAILGRIHRSSGRLQMTIDHILPVVIAEGELSQFVMGGELDVEGLYRELVQEAEALSNPWLRQLCVTVLADPEVIPKLKKAPAAKTIHHAYAGGLLEHVVALVRAGKALLPLYPQLDPSLCIFGLIFHDFGKIDEMGWQGALVGYTDAGKLVGHMALALERLQKVVMEMDGFPEGLWRQVQHLVLSHHGRLEFGSPKEPATLEAEFVHALDNLDSRLNSISKFLEANPQGFWTPVHRAYERSYFRTQQWLKTLPMPVQPGEQAYGNTERPTEGR